MKTLRTLVLFAAIGLRQVSFADGPDGQVIGWGDDFAGQATGVARIGASTGLVSVAGADFRNVIAISAGANHALALKEDGTVIGWGFNKSGEATGIPTENAPFLASGPVAISGRTLTNAVQISAGRNFSAALLRNGTVIEWGATQNRMRTNSGPFIVVAAGGEQWLAIGLDGTVHSFGIAVSPPVGLSNVVSVSAGKGMRYQRNVALMRDGTVTAWGNESIHGDLTVPSGLTNVIAISAGWSHYLALKKDGTVVGWGFNGSGQATGHPTTNAPYISSGVVWVSGSILSNVVAIAAGNDYSLGLNRDGSITAWGHPPRRLVSAWPVPSALSNVTAIAAGDAFSLAITTNSAVAERFRH